MWNLWLSTKPRLNCGIYISLKEDRWYFIREIKIIEKKVSEDEEKEYFSWLQQFLIPNGDDFFRGMKSIFEEYLSRLIK